MEHNNVQPVRDYNELQRNRFCVHDYGDAMYKA